MLSVNLVILNNKICKTDRISIIIGCTNMNVFINCIFIYFFKKEKINNDNFLPEFHDTYVTHEIF